MGLSDVEAVVERGRLAMDGFADRGQDAVDDAVTALAWSVYEPDRARELAELAVRDTGLGNVADKIAKNQRKTFGTLRDLLRVRTVGRLDHDSATGITRYGKPVGVVGAVTPSTNPAATPINKAMMAVKGGNAIVMAPSPSAWSTTARTVELARDQLTHVGAPADLVQILPEPVTREDTVELMEVVDLVVATGSQNNVRRAYRSGTPAIGVGAGNVPVIVDETADLAEASAKIAASKCFDNATSCSSENALIILDEIYEPMIRALEAVGAYRATPVEVKAIAARLFPDGQLDRALVATDAAVLADACGLDDEARFFLAEETDVGPEQPLAGEKLSLVLTVYRASDFDHAVDLVRQILDVQGRGHSCGLHSSVATRAERLAAGLPVVRVLVNQAHTFGNGGSFDNGLPFTLSMGCGTWAGNSITENLNYRHFINITHLVTTIPEDRPTEEDLFGAFWTRHGR